MALAPLLAIGLCITGSTSVSSRPQPESLGTRQHPTNQVLTIAQAELDIVDTAELNGSFTTFLALFEELGMQEDLRGFGRFTVFAPTDDAFEALDEQVLAALAGDRELLAKVLSYHVIASGSPFYADDITGTTTQRTLERSEVELRRRRGRIYVNGVQVIDADIEASNGVIHGIDEVLIPPDVTEQLP